MGFAPIPAGLGADNPGLAVHWGGTDNPNMIAAARNLPADPAQTKPLWEVTVGTHQYSIPTLNRGRIYLAVNDAAFDRTGYRSTGGGALLCLDQATGKTLWQLPSPRNFAGVNPPNHFDQTGCGTCSGPVVDGDRVFVVGSRGEILCLDRLGQANGNGGPFLNELEYMGLTNAPGLALEPTDGDLLWRYDLLAELNIVPHDVCGSTLLVLGDLLYACTSNGIDDRHDQIPQPEVPSLIVLDKKTGRLVAHDNEKMGRHLLHGTWSSPSAGQVQGRSLIFFGGGDGVLYAFEPPAAGPGAGVQTLKKVWAHDCNPPHFRTLDGQPVPYSKHNKNTTTGPSEIIGTPVFHQGRVYVAIGQSPIHGNGRGCLSCLDAATGETVWASELVDRSLSTVAIAEGLLYLADCTGNLHCFNAGTGQRYWVHPLGAKTWAASAWVADHKVYVGTEASIFWVLQAGPELRVLSRTRLKSPPITPTACDGVLYLPTQRTLAAIPGPATAAPPASAADPSKHPSP